MRRTMIAVSAVLLFVPGVVRAQERKQTDDKIDKAIAAGLKYLAHNQNPDGSWGDRGGKRGPNAAVTGLCVMAFLSAGHVPDEGPYAKTVKNGIQAVLDFQDKNKNRKTGKTNGVIANNHSHEMYHHGICTLMLAEVVGMTQDRALAEKCREGLKAAVRVILARQQKPNNQYKGGWRYNTGHTSSDMSITGWQILALRAAKNVGCDVPPKAVDDAIAYLQRSQVRSGRYKGAFRYTPGGNPTVACTGTGVLALELCGKKFHRSQETLAGGQYLMKHLPRWMDSAHFFYSIYYRSQACFQLGGNYWEAYRDKLHPMMIKAQSTSDGSWRGGSYGYNYSSAMCILSLTVEYRFLPIYQRGNEPIDR